MLFYLLYTIALCYSFSCHTMEPSTEEKLRNTRGIAYYLNKRQYTHKKNVVPNEDNENTKNTFTISCINHECVGVDSLDYFKRAHNIGSRRKPEQKILWQHISSIDFSCNQIKRPNFTLLFTLPALKNLNLDHNQIQRIFKKDTAAIPSEVAISLVGNSIDRCNFSPCFFEKKNITLNLENNPLTEQSMIKLALLKMQHNADENNIIIYHSHYTEDTIASSSETMQ